jgi:(p)ppGpp synthase/HD superfamily hydrolase
MDNTVDTAVMDKYVDDVYEMLKRKGVNIDDLSANDHEFIATYAEECCTKKLVGEAADQIKAELHRRPTLVDHAMKIVLDGHQGQRDKAGCSYFGHLIRVAGRFYDEKSIAIALLHDVVEDTKYTLDQLRFIFPPSVVDAVDALSRRPGEPYKVYLKRLKPNRRARRVKIADIRDNLSRARGPITKEMETARGQYWAGLATLDHKEG